MLNLFAIIFFYKVFYYFCCITLLATPSCIVFFFILSPTHFFKMFYALSNEFTVALSKFVTQNIFFQANCTSLCYVIIVLLQNFYV